MPPVTFIRSSIHIPDSKRAASNNRIGYMKSLTFQKDLLQHRSLADCKTKYHLLLGQHSGTTNMEAEVRIQNHLINPPPDYLIRKTILNVS